MRWLWRNIVSLFPQRRYDPFRYGADKHLSPWDGRTGDDQLREIIDSGEIKMGGLPRAQDD